MIDGREYLLAGRVSNKESAQDEARRIRARGRLARIVKVNTFDWKIYQH